MENVLQQTYSLNRLAEAICQLSWTAEVIELNWEQFQFTDITAEVTGRIYGVFDYTKATEDTPSFCDLKYTVVDIYGVKLFYESKEKYFTLDEIRALEVKLESLIK